MGLRSTFTTEQGVHRLYWTGDAVRTRNGLSEYRGMEWDGALLRWICRSSVHLLSLYWTGGGGDHSRPVEGRGRESLRGRGR